VTVGVWERMSERRKVKDKKGNQGLKVRWKRELSKMAH
jgi:hypothetical protein